MGGKGTGVNGFDVREVAGRLKDSVKEITTYLPDNSVRQGYASLVGDIVVELWANRWLTFQLFKRDLSAFYKQSVLGGLWLLLIPLITVGTFVVLRGSGVVAAGEMSTPYPIFAVLGVAVWQLFAHGLVAAASSLVAGGDMISRINFSKKALIIGSMGRAVVSFAVLVALSLVMFGIYMSRGFAYTPTVGLLLVPLALIPTMLLTLGLGFYLALLNAVMRDIANMLGVVVTFLMLLTPVLYEAPKLADDAGELARFFATLTDYNPLYYLVSAPRELVLTGHVTEVRGFLISSAVSFGIFCFALVSFHLTETRITERI